MPGINGAADCAYNAGCQGPGLSKRIADCDGALPHKDLVYPRQLKGLQAQSVHVHFNHRDVAVRIHRHNLSPHR